MQQDDHTLIIESRGSHDSGLPKRDVWQAMWRGAKCRCPNCGEGRLFSRYLKAVDHCGVCGEAMHHHRADDAPPYFTVFGAGHLIVPLMLSTERMFAPALWIYMAVFIPLTILICLVLLPITKGATIGLQWANYMHGFDPLGADDAVEMSATVKPAARLAVRT